MPTQSGRMFKTWLCWLAVQTSFSLVCGGGARDVTSELLMSSASNFRPVAFGDYNSDKKIDAAFLSANGTFLQLYLGYEDAPVLRPSKGYQCDLSEWKGKVQGVAFADFTGDGVLDVLITLGRENHVEVLIVKGNLLRLECDVNSVLQLNGTSATLLMKQEPLVVDVNGDMIADLFGESAEDGKRLVWKFSPATKSTPPKPVQVTCNKEQSCNKLWTPAVQAFADIDGDFAPELILVSAHDQKPHLEVFQLRRSTEWNFEQDLVLPIKDEANDPKVIGSLLLADVNQTGSIIPIIPYCIDSECRRSGLYLFHKKAFIDINLNLTDATGKTWGFPPSETITLRLGDYDLDGFPDLIGVLQDSSKPPKRSGFVFLNVACEERSCKYPRTFNTWHESVLREHENTLDAIFFDVYDNGLVDVMLWEDNSKNAPSSNLDSDYDIHVVLNAPKYDGYFFKWQMTSGLSTAQSSPPYGAVLPGASMNYSMLDLHGRTQVSRAAQFYRSCSFPLDLPYVVVGIGSTPNFIDTVWIGRNPSKYRPTIQRFRQIIPNSHLVVIPYPGKWELKHFLSTNTKGAVSTLQALLLIIFINGVVVFLFWIKERKEDRREDNMTGNLNFIRLS